MELTDPYAAQRRSGEENMNIPDDSVNTLTQANTHKHRYLPQELGSRGSYFYDATSKPLTLHHRRH